MTIMKEMVKSTINGLTTALSHIDDEREKVLLMSAIQRINNGDRVSTTLVDYLAATHIGGAAFDSLTKAATEAYNIEVETIGLHPYDPIKRTRELGGNK